MTHTMPDRAFILAAGMGRRLAPYTDTMPKPMVPVAGRAMIDHALDRLGEAGVRDVTINLHYRAAQLQQHLSLREAPRLTFSYESALLDTGGGIKKALYTMGGKAFFCLSGDMLWTDTPPHNALARLAQAWNDRTMDLLLLLQPLTRMTVTPGTGDYHLDPAGKPVRALDKSGAYFWPSVRIIHPRLFENTPENTPFSFLELMDRAEKAGRLGAVLHDGACYHISNPADLAAVNAVLRGQANPKVA